MKDKPLPLGPLEYTLLELLLRNRGLTIPRETCMETLWSKEGKDINDNTLSVLVKRLREKLGSTGQSITTIRGIGYRWEDDYGK
ncbi:MAG: winged helix-turn-helix domain-containing protein [Tissierellia bacterium]|nr:winged helix-turn-helix domain-containing protein [Tissierellia bacterium]